MKVDKDTAFAVGKALRELDRAGQEQVTSVKVDGVEVDVEEAQAMFDARSAKAEEAAWALLDKLEAKAGTYKTKLQKTKIGRGVTGVLEHDPERVSHTAQLELTLDDGRKVQMPLEVVDIDVTRFLQRASMSIEVVSMLPIIGNMILGSSAVLSALASLLARGLGRGDLADALLKTAGKQAVLTGVGFVPFVSSAANALAAVGDRQDARDLTRVGVPCGDVIHLASLRDAEV